MTINNKNKKTTLVTMLSITLAMSAITVTMPIQNAEAVIGTNPLFSNFFETESSTPMECQNRPPGTVCVGYNDGFIWLTNALGITGITSTVVDGYTIEVRPTISNGNFCHMLGTNYVANSDEPFCLATTLSPVSTIDLEGNKDGFGFGLAEGDFRPVSTSPFFFDNRAVDDPFFTDVEPIPTTGMTPTVDFSYTHSFTLPAGIITDARIGMLTIGIQDGDTQVSGSDTDVKLFLDEVEVPGAFDNVDQFSIIPGEGFAEIVGEVVIEIPSNIFPLLSDGGVDVRIEINQLGTAPSIDAFAIDFSELTIDSLVNPALPTFVLDATDSQGDCDTIGTWNQNLLKCKLDSNVQGTIIIKDDGITLSGKDGNVVHKVIGDGTGNGIKVRSSVSGATITDVIVKGHNTGIVINGDNNVVKKTTVKDSTTNGIVVGGTGNMVEQSKANSNGNNGIKLKANSSYASIENTTAKNNGKNGILVDGSNHELEYDIANSNGSNGIKLDATSSNTSIENNTANKNTKYGFNNHGGATIQQAENNTCKNNGSGGSNNPTGPVCGPQT